MKSFKILSLSTYPLTIKGNNAKMIKEVHFANGPKEARSKLLAWGKIIPKF
jgi:hypothetical protein